MAFFIYDYSNTNILHRKALLNAIEAMNAKTDFARDLTVVVSTRNMIKALPKVLMGNITPVINIVGFGRLYSDYGIFGRIIFNLIVKFYGMTSAAGFIVEHDVDKRHLDALGVKPVFTTHGSGLDVEGFTRNRGKGKRLRFGYLSRFDDSKGSHQILKAAHHLPDDRELIIAGWDIKGTRYSQKFRALAATRPNITFLGKLSSRQAVSGFFNSIDVFLSPSVREGGNIALQEAIWHGVPFLTTDAPGCKVLADRFNCPAIAMDGFADTLLSLDLISFAPDTSDWDELLKPFMTNTVEDEFRTILQTIAKNIG
ncbi:MAG: glycosyltransferase [Candidatus Puniceispirillales bacterium WSBS_2018_MAG_OTU23]